MTSAAFHKVFLGNVSSGKMTTRETSFRVSDHPGIVFPGNVLSGKMTIRETTFRETSFREKKPSGKVTIRETTVYHDRQQNRDPNVFSLQITCAMSAREHCRISPPRFLTECCKKRLHQASFVLLCFVLFAFSGLCFCSGSGS